MLLKGQINVCIATQPDTISGVSQSLLNETFSSLSAATPAGTTYAFDATIAFCCCTGYEHVYKLVYDCVCSAATELVLQPTNANTNKV
jgi:hypothetical protein